VVAIILVLFAILRSRLSVENPGKLQLTFESDVQVRDRPDDEAVEHGKKSRRFSDRCCFSILFMNLIGVIPGFESPINVRRRPRSERIVAVFFTYHWMGLREQGVGRYLIHFAVSHAGACAADGPIELISLFRGRFP